MRTPSIRSLVGIVCSLAFAAACTPAGSDGGGTTGPGGAGASGGAGGRGGSRGGTGGSAGSSSAGGAGGSAGGAGGSAGGAGGSAGTGSGGTTGGTGSGGTTGGAGGSAGYGGGGAGGAPGPDGGSEGPPPSSGSQSKMIKLDTTAAGAGVMGDVPKYPVAILLDATSFDFSQAKPKGEDIRFAGADGTPLPYEIELWDATGKKAAIWVKVDVKGNSTQMIKMTWGDANAAAGSNGAAVFSKDDGYLGVWHLGEPGSMTADGYRDSSWNEAHATGVNRAPATGEGPIGKSIVLDNAGAMKQWAEISAQKTVLDPRNMTYSIWVNAKSHNVEYQAMFTKGEGDFRIHYFGKAEYYGNRHLTESCLESSVSNDVCPVNRNGADVKPGTGWYHLLAIHKHPETSYFVNGKQEALLRAPEAWKTNATAKVMIGNNSSSTGRAFDGSLDEARLMVVAKDANWAKLEYESQRSGGKFVSFAAQ